MTATACVQGEAGAPAWRADCPHRTARAAFTRPAQNWLALKSYIQARYTAPSINHLTLDRHAAARITGCVASAVRFRSRHLARRGRELAGT